MMRKALFFVAALSFMTIVGVSCSAKRSAYDGTRHRLSSEIKEIVVTGNGRVTLVAGKSNAIEVVEDRHDLFSYRERGEKLYIGETAGFKARRLFRPDAYSYEVVVYISDLKDLEELKVTGASRLYFDEAQLRLKEIDIEVEGASRVDWSGKADEISLDVSGASSVEYIGDFRKIEIDISGASRAIVAGRGKEAKVDVSGASRLEGSKMRVDLADVDVSGASRVEIAADRLRQDVSGASSISNRW